MRDEMPPLDPELKQVLDKLFRRPEAESVQPAKEHKFNGVGGGADALSAQALSEMLGISATDDDSNDDLQLDDPLCHVERTQVVTESLEVTCGSGVLRRTRRVETRDTVVEPDAKEVAAAEFGMAVYDQAVSQDALTGADELLDAIDEMADQFVDADEGLLDVVFEARNRAVDLRNARVDQLERTKAATDVAFAVLHDLVSAAE